MKLEKQHIVLSLLFTGRYSVDHETGNVVSHIGREPRILQPIRLYTGYLEYQLDIGFNQKIMVYGQSIAYLSRWRKTHDPAFVIDHIDANKANNRPDNLRCITQKENVSGNRIGKLSMIKRHRLPIDQRESMKTDFLAGISMNKLAEKYGVTRQTVSRIVNVK